MKKLIIFALVLALALGGCSGPAESESASMGSLSAGPSSKKQETEIVYNDSFPAFGVQPSCSLEFGEISFLSYFSPLIPLFYYDGVDMDGDEPISAEFAYKCFEASLCENRLKMDNYEELIQKTEDIYVWYYPKETVENYISAQFGVSPDELEKLEEYDSENLRYRNSYYSGIGKGSADILEQELKGDTYAADFVFDGALHQVEPIRGHIELKYVDDHFVLVSLTAKH